MEKKFTTIATKKGHFIVLNDCDEKYFLEYLENDSHPQRVGYLVKENGTGYNGAYFLQEAFFDKRNWPHTSLRLVLNDCGDDLNKDLWDVLFAACYQIEQAFWCKGSKRKRLEKSQKWAELIDKLQKGAALETAVRSYSNGVKF